MNFIKCLIFSMLLVVGLSLSAGNVSALTAPIDDEPASQLISYYNSESDSVFALQVTNTNVSSGVDVHIQTIQTDKSTAPVCVEVKNFFFALTGADTHIFTEDQLGIPDNTEGLIIINAVASAGSFVPVDFPHLVGHSWIINDEGSDDAAAALYNAAGRNLNGGVFDTLTPVNIIAPYDNLTLDEDLREDFNLATAAWADTYTGSGAYIADTGTVTATGNDDLPVGVFNFDEIEIPISCGDFASACATCTGINDVNGTDEGSTCNDEEGDILCSDANDSGFLALIGVDAVDNVFALTGQGDTNDTQGLDYAALVSLGDDGIEPPVDCDAVADVCAEEECVAECIAQECVTNADCSKDVCDGQSIEAGSVCSGGVATETDCTDVLDNDGDTLTDCDDTDCADTAACTEVPDDGEGGGDGGCSIAAASTGLGSMANALVLLIPAFGIGARRIRQRLNK